MPQDKTPPPNDVPIPEPQDSLGAVVPSALPEPAAAPEPAALGDSPEAIPGAVIVPAPDGRSERLERFLKGELPPTALSDLTHEERYAVAEEGSRLFEAGQISTARRIFELLVALDPNDYNFACALGVAYLAQGELDQAIEAFDRALELNHFDIAALTNRASAYLQKGDVERAAADIVAVDALDPEGQHPHTAIARQMAADLIQAETEPSE